VRVAPVFVAGGGLWGRVGRRGRLARVARTGPRFRKVAAQGSARYRHGVLPCRLDVWPALPREHGSSGSQPA